MLSPARAAAPAAHVYLLHGTDDNVIPAIESYLLADTLRRRGVDGRPARHAAHHARGGGQVGRRAGDVEAGELLGRDAGGVASTATQCRCSKLGTRDFTLGHFGLRLGLQPSRSCALRPRLGRAAALFNAATSRASSSRNSPGRMCSSAIGPMRTRLQPVDGMADRLAHLAHLAVAALVDDDRQQGVLPAAAFGHLEQLDPGRRGPPAVDDDALREPLDLVLVGHAQDLRPGTRARFRGAGGSASRRGLRRSSAAAALPTRSRAARSGTRNRARRPW